MKNIIVYNAPIWEHDATKYKFLNQYNPRKIMDSHL